MPIFLGVHVFIASLNAVIGCYALYKNPASKMHRAFFAMAVGIAGWMLGLVLLTTSGQFLFIALVLWGGEIAVLGLFVFSQTFPANRAWTMHTIVWLPWIAVFALAPSQWIIARVTIDMHGYLRPENGPWFGVFAVTLIGYVAASLLYLVKTFRKSSGLQRVQMRYFLFGASVFLGGALLFDVALPAFGIFFLNLVGPLCSVVFIGCTAYAIINYKFLDIRIVIKRGVVYFAAIVVVAGMFSGIEVVTEKFFYNDEIVDIIATIIGVLVFPLLKDLFEIITDKIFFRADYDYTKTVNELGSLLNSTIELEMLVGVIDGLLARTIKPAKTLFVVDHQKSPFMFVHAKHLELQNDDPARLIHDSQTVRRVTIIQETTSVRANDPISTYQYVAEGFGFAAIVPFIANDDVVGTLFLGKKLSDDIFRPKDIQLLSVLSHQGGMAILNARLYESIRQHNEELENIVDARTREIKGMYHAQEQFMTDISHQLQTPIAILEGNLELAEKNPGNNVKQSLRTMRETLDGMSHLVANFLEIAKLNFSKNKPHRDSFDVGALMEEVHEDCSVLAEAKNIQMECNADHAFVVGDRRKMKDVILNLVSNALKHTDATGSIALESWKRNDCVEIIVRDTGVGISGENLAHIFERFYRIPGTVAHGTGLGLNICREIVESHGGMITVESMLGAGSTFTIKIPLANVETAVIELMR